MGACFTSLNKEANQCGWLLTSQVLVCQYLGFQFKELLRTTWVHEIILARYLIYKSFQQVCRNWTENVWNALILKFNFVSLQRLVRNGEKGRFFHADNRSSNFPLDSKKSSNTLAMSEQPNFRSHFLIV